MLAPRDVRMLSRTEAGAIDQPALRPLKSKKTRRSGKSARKIEKKPPKRAFKLQDLVSGFRKWTKRAVLGVALAFAGALALLAFVNPPTSSQMAHEYFRSGQVKQDWTALERIPAHIPMALAAAEDANFCAHWGFDIEFMRESKERATISQQVARNLFLWRDESALRRVAEVLATWAIEAAWSKRRIMEIYVNIAEFDQGVFGVSEGARAYFGVELSDLTREQSAYLAAVLPSQIALDATNLDEKAAERVESILIGSSLEAMGERSACFKA